MRLTCAQHMCFTIHSYQWHTDDDTFAPSWHYCIWVKIDCNMTGSEPNFAHYLSNNVTNQCVFRHFWVVITSINFERWRYFHRVNWTHTAWKRKKKNGKKRGKNQSQSLDFAHTNRPSKMWFIAFSHSRCLCMSLLFCV